MSEPTLPSEPEKVFVCPKCSCELTNFELAAAADKEVQVEADDQPEMGAMTLCPACGALLVFDTPLDIGSLRVATEEEAAPWNDLPLVVTTRAALALTDDPLFADELASIMRGEGAQ